MVKLIASDMDGTLLNEKGEFDKEFYCVFKRLIDLDVKFAVASGRQYYQLLKNFEGIEDNIIYIAENGTLVRYMDKEIYSCPVTSKDVKSIIKTGNELTGICMVLCGKKSAYISNTEERMVKECRKYYNRLDIVKDLNDVEDDILKVAILDFDRQNETFKHFKEKINTNLQVIVSGQVWIDIYRKEVNKGVALRLIQEKFNFKKEETMVFGDYFNDIEMLNEAYYSYAMENAPDEVKKHARFIAKSNIENGVIQIIKEIVLKPVNMI